jgi:hypothetical protein
VELTIRGEPHLFIPLKQFREAFHLPPDFGVSLFQPKNPYGLGRLDAAGPALQEVHQVLVAAVPQQTPQGGWFAATMELQILFHRQLYKINPVVGLQRAEIDYAVIQFGSVCQVFLLELFSSRLKGHLALPFEVVYSDWLNQSIELSTPYSYPHGDETWHIELIWHAYGRVGIIVHTRTGSYYVRDAALACPAEGFMLKLLQEVTARLRETFYRPGV